MSPTRLRIAFIGGRGVGAAYSGIETYYEEVGSRLAARGNDVTVYCRRYFTPDVEEYRGMRVRRLPAPRGKHVETIVHSTLATLDSLRREFDVVHYHAIGSSPLALVLRLLGRRTVVTVHGLDWQRAKWGRTARAVLKACEWTSVRCPTTTTVVSQALQRHYLEAHGRETVFIPNAVSTPTTRPPRGILEHGLEPGKFFLYAGRLSPEKGVDTLLAALGPVHRGFKLAIAGGTSYSDGYIEALRRAAWDGVVFLGNVDRPMMDELYSNCHAFVLPSAMEGLSIALLEAMSHGACILTTAIPENLEVVDSAALTFPYGDVTALRAQLRKVIEEPGVAAEYRRRAKARAEGQPGWEEVAQRTEALYYSLLDGPRVDAPRVRAAGS